MNKDDSYTREYTITGDKLNGSNRFLNQSGEHAKNIPESNFCENSQQCIPNFPWGEFYLGLYI